MIRKKESTRMGKSNLGWLKSTFHFSFSQYYNEENISFGVLRVLNDDLIEPNKGFDFHPHRDMEIITYVIDGALTHGDNMGNKRTLTRGNVQYMSAGTGVFHSEHNYGKEILRLLQIWIYPDKKDHTPNYGDYILNRDDRLNKWHHIISDKKGNAPIKINQDANLYIIELEKDNGISFNVDQGRQAYLVQIEGDAIINEISLKEKDALEVMEECINITTSTNAHLILIEMKKQG